MNNNIKLYLTLVLNADRQASKLEELQEERNSVSTSTTWTLLSISLRYQTEVKLFYHPATSFL